VEKTIAKLIFSVKKKRSGDPGSLKRNSGPVPLIYVTGGGMMAYRTPEPRYRMTDHGACARCCPPSIRDGAVSPDRRQLRDSRGFRRTAGLSHIPCPLRGGLEPFWRRTSFASGLETGMGSAWRMPIEARGTDSDISFIHQDAPVTRPPVRGFHVQVPSLVARQGIDAWVSRFAGIPTPGARYFPPFSCQLRAGAAETEESPPRAR